jgi:hypothetical protein
MSSTSKLSRRKFLKSLGSASLAIPVLAGQDLRRSPGGRFPPGPGQKTVLTSADFEYLGAFKLPTNVGAGDPQWGLGLAHRKVGRSEFRFFSRSNGNPKPAAVYEVAAPRLTDDPENSETARLVRVWGDIAGTESYGTTWGLFWDEEDERLYWTTGNAYNARAPYDPSIGYRILDGRTGQMEGGGVWALANRSCKMAMGGLVSIPEWFSDAYCHGQRLGAGCGGYFSIATTGPISMGPALAAFDPRTLSAPIRSAVPNTPLVGYPFNAVAYTSPDRCHRDTDYTTEFDGWKTRNDVGYWSWSDSIWQGAVWIDTPEKTGLMFFPTLGNGRTWYERSTLHAERASHWWYVYDPADLAAVATKKKQQWQIQPAQTWSVQYPGVRYPLSGWADEPKQPVVGASFDRDFRTLYVAVRFALGVRAGSPIVVYAYRVS